MTVTRVVVEGLAFAECPRWHAGKLWFSDQHDGRVCTLEADGRLTEIVKVPMQPSGLGFAPDGSLWIVSMKDRRLLRWSEGALSLVADLSPWASHHCNDMVMDAQGRAYVGNFGFDLDHGESPALTRLLMVQPNGEVSVAAEGLAFPNGSVITPAGKTLIVGETFGACLTAFTIHEDGSLSDRRTWAMLDGGASPDGICLDAEGAIWVTSPSTSEVLRVREGGEVSARVPVSTRPFACMLGGVERRSLFICTAETFKPQHTVARRTGRIEVVDVDVPGAGRP